VVISGDRVGAGVESCVPMGTSYSLVDTFTAGCIIQPPYTLSQIDRRQYVKISGLKLTPLKN